MAVRRADRANPQKRLSRLELLPNELKLIIFSYVFSVDPFKTWPSTRPVGSGLLRVNKAIHKLVIELYYKETSFCIHTLPNLRRFSKLDSVSLYCSLIQHFAFPSATRTTIKINKPTINKLKFFPNLKTLTFEADPTDARWRDKVFHNLPHGDAAISPGNGHKALHLLVTELPSLKIFLHRFSGQRVRESRIYHRWHLYPHGVSKQEYVKYVDYEYDSTWRVMRDEADMKGRRYRLVLEESWVRKVGEDEIIVKGEFERILLSTPQRTRMARPGSAYDRVKKVRGEAVMQRDMRSEGTCVDGDDLEDRMLEVLS